MIGKRLKTFRKKIGKTQTELGQELGVTLGTVQNWEAETRNIKESIIQLLTAKYDLNSDWLKTGEGEILNHKEITEELNEDLKELILLLKDYGNAKIISDFKNTLLKIKKATDEMDKS